MIFLAFIPALLLALGAAFWLWDAQDEQSEWYKASKLPPKERHRREMYLTYLPQSEYEAQLLDEAIDRGEL